jgi:amino acid transporter
MLLWSFEQLIVIDVTLYGGGLFLEFVTLLKLRIKAPERDRPFRIPFNTTGLCIMLIIPVIVFAIAVSGAFATEGKVLIPAVFALSALVSAEVAWQIISLRKKMKKEVV